MLEISLLGQFELRLAGEPVELASRPAQSLLAYLLLHPEAAHRRERLAGLLWPDSSEANARRNLRQALWQIRRALGPASETLIEADDLTIAIHLGAEQTLDVAILQQPPANNEAVETLISRVAVYRGELLPGFYEDWAVLERERLQALFEQTIQTLLDHLVAEGQWGAVLQWGERWIAYGFTPEPAYRALMLAHAANGDMAAVADVYRRCAEALARDLAVEPSEQTRALYERLRRGETPPSPPPSTPLAPPVTPERPRSNLPVHLTSFIGRQREIAAIQRLLQEHRLVTLTGPGGTGKTRLALQVAHRLLAGNRNVAAKAGDPMPAFPDGVWLVELSTVADPQGVESMVAVVLGVREESALSPLQSIIEALRTKATLLILDNCEHLLDACASLADALLRACPGVKILTTGRELLGVIGESVLRVPSLSLPNGVELSAPAALLDYEAVRLFVERAAAVRPEFMLNEANAAAIVHICRQLDGVPLAIELAAARVRSMTPDQISTRLNDRFRLLTGGSRSALPRQQTLRALIDWSWDLLAEAECTLLRRLAVFRGGWTLEAAETVCLECAGGPPSALILRSEEVLDLLTHLVDKSLVVLQDEPTGPRYDMLETIRQYALEKLIEAGESKAARTRHLDYYLQLAETAAPKLRTREQLDWLARLETEHDNLHSALKWSADSEDMVPGLQLAGALARFWYLRGYWMEGRAWLRVFLERATTEEPRVDLAHARMVALAGAGWLADEDGSDVPLYTESLALARQLGDCWYEAFSLRGLAAVTTNWANPEQAGPQLEESLAIFSALGDDWGMALVRFNRGWLALDYDEPERAAAEWEAALAGFQRGGDRWGLAVTIGGLGYVARLRGQYEHSAELIHTSLAYFRDLGDRAGVAVSLNRLGNLAFRRGDYREATAFLQESIAVLHGQHELQSLIAALQILGLVAGYQGDFAHAEGYIRNSLDQARLRGINSELAEGMGYLAFLAYLQDDLAGAADLFQTSIKLFERNQDHDGIIAFADYGLGLVALQQGDELEAGERLTRSLRRYRAQGDKRSLALALDGLGRLALQQGERNVALAHWRESLLLRRPMGDKQGIAESLERSATAANDASTAVRLLAAADSLRQTIGAPLPPVEQRAYTTQLRQARLTLGDNEFDCAWRAGQQLTVESAIGLALEVAQGAD